MRSTSAAWLAATGGPRLMTVRQSLLPLCCWRLYCAAAVRAGPERRQDFAYVLGTDHDPKALRARGKADPAWAARGSDGVRGKIRPAGSRRRGRIDDPHAAR